VLADKINDDTRGLDKAVAAAVEQAAARVPALATRMADAQVPEVTSVADLNRVPVLTKDDLIAAQRTNPVTLLRPDQPLVRFGTGDLSAWTLGADGSLRLTREPGVSAHRFVIDRTDHRDNLRCEIVAAQSSDPHLLRRLRDLIRTHLRLSAEVVRVPTLPDGPTIDDQRDWS
jgi:hypothetical protein